MTEYDYSPEAYERYIAKQHKIMRWVDETSRTPQKNPFLPPTPAVHTTDLLPQDNDPSGRAYRRPSKHRRQNSHTMSPDPGQPLSRQRSISYSMPGYRPPPVRSQTAPHQQIYINPNSGYSSRSSTPYTVSPRSASPAAKTSPGVNGFSYPFPHQQYPDYDSVRPSQPVRSKTVPPHRPSASMDHSGRSYVYVTPSSPGKTAPYIYRTNVSPVADPSPNTGQAHLPAQLQLEGARLAQYPQLPFSAYERPKKQVPLFKRLFNGLGGNKNNNNKKTYVSRSGYLSPEASPTKSKLRRRRSSL